MLQTTHPGPHVSSGYMPRSITTTSGILAIAFIRTRPTLTETSEPSDFDAVELMRVRSSHGGMLKRDEPHRDLGADWYSRRNREAHTRRLVKQLEKLGHTVVLDPAA